MENARALCLPFICKRVISAKQGPFFSAFVFVKGPAQMSGAGAAAAASFQPPPPPPPLSLPAAPLLTPGRRGPPPLSGPQTSFTLNQALFGPPGQHVPTAPNLLISPQEEAAVSDTQLSGLLPGTMRAGGGPLGSATRPLFLRPGGPAASATVGSTCWEAPPAAEPAPCPPLGPHPSERAGRV